MQEGVILVFHMEEAPLQEEVRTQGPLSVTAPSSC